MAIFRLLTIGHDDPVRHEDNLTEMKKYRDS